MIRDITIGQYYKTDSCIHRLDPRTKIVITFLYLISLFIGRNPILYGMATVFLLGYIALSRIPIKHMLKGLRPIMYILVFSMILNLFQTPGEPVFTWHFLTITKAGIEMAVYVGIRMIYIILGASLMTYTTTPTALTDGIEQLLSWLHIFKIPVHELAMMISIALRFIPILVEELDKIMNAQMARGAEFNTGSLIKRLKSMVPIIVPLFVSAIRRANDLALAMDARCYQGGKGRTKMKPLRYHRGDILAFGILAVYMVMAFASVVIVNLF